MEQLSKLLDSLAAPLLIPFSPDQRIYVFYLVTALAIAYLVYAAARDRGAPEAQGGFLRQVFPKWIYTHRSAWTDYKFFLVNKIAYPLLFAPLVLGAAVAAKWERRTAGRHLGARGARVRVRPGERCLDDREPPPRPRFLRVHHPLPSAQDPGPSGSSTKSTTRPKC